VEVAADRSFFKDAADAVAIPTARCSARRGVFDHKHAALT
jgi:hypothetical protein